jgi:peptidyl-prolyl cis-trans isomerase SurA
MSATKIMRKVSLHHIPLACALLCAFGSLPAAAQVAGKPTGGFLPPASASANVIDSIAIVVNDEVITRNEIAARIRSIQQRMQAQNAPMPEADDLQRQVSERMITERAQLQMAREMGVRIDDTQLDRAIARIAESQKMSVQDLRNAMEKEGTPFAAFREEIRNEMAMARLREHEVDAKVQITDAEVDTYLAAAKAAAAEAVELNLSQITVRIPENASPEQIAARKARADEVMRQLRTGADFAKIAVTYSDASDALKGGEIGWRNPEGLPPIFAEALGKLKPGQFTPVIKSATGFHILKVAGKRSAAPAPEQALVQQSRVRHILLKPSPTLTPAEAKRKLAELKERLDNKAATFEELARLYSQDTQSAAKGGDLGWLYPGDIVPEFESVVNAMKPGEVSGITETPFGLHLIELVERKSDDQTKERQRNTARQTLREQKVTEATEDWARQIRDRAYVEFRDEK